jgi:hypothetical protein
MKIYEEEKKKIRLAMAGEGKMGFHLCGGKLGFMLR